VKRIPAGLIAAVAVVAVGALASACDVTPNAASVNGDTVSVSSLNTQMNALADSSAGACLIALNGDPTVTPGSSYPTAYAGKLLSGDVGDLLAAQFAAAHAVRLTGSDLSTAQNDYASALDGAITSLNSQATAASVGSSPCQSADGTAYTGQELLAALPASVRNTELANQAVDNVLLARGADLSNAAVLNYYAANQPQFAIDCVSDIATATQAEANQIVAKLTAGKSFATLAKSSSIDSQTASGGGALGCNFTESRVLSALQLTTVTPGQPVTPIQASSGMWVIYEVTSQTVVPASKAAPVIRQDLLQTTANTRRVTDELLVFAHHSSITVNPQYGTWTGVQITPPPTPPTRFLEPAYVLPGGTGTSTSAGG
jgi:peptidyl-prolyl cis-trans isomerase C